MFFFVGQQPDAQVLRDVVFAIDGADELCKNRAGLSCRSRECGLLGPEPLLAKDSVIPFPGNTCASAGNVVGRRGLLFVFLRKKSQPSPRDRLTLLSALASWQRTLSNEQSRFGHQSGAEGQGNAGAGSVLLLQTFEDKQHGRGGHIAVCGEHFA